MKKIILIGSAVCGMAIGGCGNVLGTIQADTEALVKASEAACLIAHSCESVEDARIACGIESSRTSAVTTIKAAVTTVNLVNGAKCGP